jgi:hypothetical protein
MPGQWCERASRSDDWQLWCTLLEHVLMFVCCLRVSEQRLVDLECSAPLHLSAPDIWLLLCINLSC